jgi:predicted nucleic acid-binding protein
VKHLLDVNVLLAACWSNHPLNARATAWLAGKEVLLCPLSELGFLRISTNLQAVGVPMEDARKAIEYFARAIKADRIAADLPALNSRPRKSEEVTDHYLADLAARHGARLGTFDTGVKHAAADAIP